MKCDYCNRKFFTFIYLEDPKTNNVYIVNVCKKHSMEAPK